jgi:hypothetical protein
MDKETDDLLMLSLGETEQIELFDTNVVQDLIRYKWGKYGKHVHWTAATIHMVYVITFLGHYSETYLQRRETYLTPAILVMGLCNLFACIYDGVQFYKQGWRDYFLDAWNFYD